MKIIIHGQYKCNKKVHAKSTLKKSTFKLLKKVLLKNKQIITVRLKILFLLYCNTALHTRVTILKML